MNNPETLTDAIRCGNCGVVRPERDTEVCDDCGVAICGRCTRTDESGDEFCPECLATF
jgi:hypothetical protein